MAQASSRWQQLVNLLQGSQVAEIQRKTIKPLGIYRFRGPGGWLLGLTVVVAMLYWNWRLLLATGVGVLVMLLVYLMQEWDWQVHWFSLRRLLSGSNRQLTLAVGSGGIAAFSTYMAVCIWVDSDSPWIAAGAILQGFGTLCTLILLLGQIMSRQTEREEAKLNQLVHDLTHTDPLKRLIAVRQIARFCKDPQLGRETRRTISDYFRLMLSREQEPVVRDAVLESLQALEEPQLLSKVAPPLKLPAPKKQSAKVYNRST